MESVVSSLHCMNDPQPEGHMASYIGRRKFLATLGGAFHRRYRHRVVGDEAGSRIDMRSTSRQGRSDYGVNAARIRVYMSALRKRIG